MALKPVEKMNLFKYIKSNPMVKVYFGDMCDAIARRKGNVSYVEVIEYCVNYMLDIFNGKNSFNMKLFNKFLLIIATLFVWCNDDNIEVDEILVGRIRMLNSDYNEYKTKNELPEDEEVVKLFGVIDEVLAEKYPVDNKEDVVAYIREISRLQEEIKSLKKELEDKAKDCESAFKELKDKEKELKKKQEDTGKANNEAQKQKALAEKLDKQVKEMQGKLAELERKCAQLQEVVDRLQGDNEKLESLRTSLENEISALRALVAEKEGIIAAKESIIASFNEQKRRESIVEQEEADKDEIERRIEESLFSKLLTTGGTIDELVASLNEEGLLVDNDDVYNHIANIRNTANISTPSFGATPKYIVVPPTIVRNGVFDITLPPGCKSYDILLTSDYHISTLDKNAISDYDKILDYCEVNNIRLVINAGDFFCFKFPAKGNMLKGFTDARKVVDRAIAKLPTNPNVYHAILGGNHDKDSLRYGFDAITSLTNAREDYLHLGYDHAAITFNGQRSMLTSFMVHHINGRFPEPVMDEDFSNHSLVQSLESYYNNVNRSRNDTYFDALGHIHKSELDLLNSICTIPSLRFDRFNNGAWHLKVYFDEKTNIKYVVFKPLDLTDKLVPTTELIYQKLVLK